jgi:hypothetical protein
MVSLDVAADLFSGRDLIGIIPDQIDLLLFDRPIKPLGKRIVGRASHPGKRQIGCQGVEKLLGDCRCVGRSSIHSELGLALNANANLNGIEYIISEQLFETLTQEERQYWHPHNGEILSGQLVAPGISASAEKELMKGKMNSYGKTWHVWATDRGDKLPLGRHVGLVI